MTNQEVERLTSDPTLIWHHKQEVPEHGRRILIDGNDTFGNFQCEGEYRMYVGTNRGRFMRKSYAGGGLIVDRNSWADRDRWAYLDEAKVGA